MLGLRVPEPDEALLISGRKGKEGVPFRVVIGHRTFVMPFISRARTLTLAMQESNVGEPCLSSEMVQLQLRATVAFKVDTNEASIIDAGQRFLSDQKQMPILVGQIISGHLRGIVGEMTVADIISKRQTLAGQVLDASKDELGGLGLKVDSFQITSVDDGDQGYIDALRKPHLAAAARDAAIAEAKATQASVEAQQESERNQANSRRETAVTEAGYEAAVNVANAERDQKSQVAQAQQEAAVGAAKAKAEQAAPLAEATAKQEVLDAQTLVAEKNAELREKELVGEVVKPAEADAQKVSITAKADADATKLRAEAAESNNRVALDQLLIQQMPELVQSIAQGLQGSNLTVLNGSEGLTELAAGLVAQVGAVLSAARDATGQVTSNQAAAK